MITIAVDAMGSDHAPRPEIEGALAASRLDPPVHVILVGREEVLRPKLEEAAGKLPPNISIVHASEHITMHESAAKAVRNKRDSSVRVCARLVRDGQANGFVSAGHTGAVMATAKMVQGVVKGVERPALASVLPTIKGKPVVLLDVGANVDCTPNMLAQFAIMGEVYSRTVFHTPCPSVGLLSIGEEEHKGNELTRAAFPLLKSLPLNFHGNVEGRDIYHGVVDVVVCDGFAGNVALKVSEGVADVIKHMLRESLAGSMAGKIGYAISRSAYAEFRRRIDYSEYGGAPLLGVKGVCLICHGRSNGNAIKNAVRIAADYVRSQGNERIERELETWAESRARV